MGDILNKYYKLRYSIISRDGHVCMEGEPVTIIKKITEIPYYYLCSVSFFKNREEPILIETRLCGLVEITKEEFLQKAIENFDRPLNSRLDKLINRDKVLKKNETSIN